MKDLISTRYVVTYLRECFARSWIRAYFSTGNLIPLIIVVDEDCDEEYCKRATEFCGGELIYASTDLGLDDKLDYNQKKALVIREIASRFSPKSWAWIDDDVEITGNIDECFDYSESSLGFICAKFCSPSSTGNRHPDASSCSLANCHGSLCFESMIFFHGDANVMLSSCVNETNSANGIGNMFYDLYMRDKRWENGFCDYSLRGWIVDNDTEIDVRKNWFGKAICYNIGKGCELTDNIWASMFNKLPAAPFEQSIKNNTTVNLSDDPIDAVFVVGTGSEHDDEELRYALRSIENNCRFVRDVYICGYCPHWVDKKTVKFLQWPDRFSHAKDANIIDKLRHACECPGIAKNILFCSDDQFQTRPCSWDDFTPRYLRKFSIGDRWYKDRNRAWHTRLYNTLKRDVDRRRLSGMDESNVFYYQPHIWMQIDRDDFINYARWCNYENRTDTIIASGYYNFIDAKGRPDFDHTFIDMNCFEMPKSTHVAYYDNSYNNVMSMLRKLFPSPSKFEVTRACKNNDENVIIDKKPRYSDLRALNPSKATQEEIAKISKVSHEIRNNPIWNTLLGEVSMAEELRLFGVCGWRIVWNDIISRWSNCTRDGADIVQITINRSDEASRILDAYKADPTSMRKLRFFVPGPPARRYPCPSTDSNRSLLRRRVRMFKMAK